MDGYDIMAIFYTALWGKGLWINFDQKRLYSDYPAKFVTLFLYPLQAKGKHNSTKAVVGLMECGNLFKSFIPNLELLYYSDFGNPIVISETNLLRNIN